MIGVYLQRRSDLKILGSTLDAMQRRGLRFGWINHVDDKEPLQPGDLDRWRADKRAGLDAKVILTKETSGLPSWDVPAIAIPYFWDDRLAPSPPERIICYTSERHRAFTAALHGARDPARSPIVGWTMADGFFDEHPTRAVLSRKPYTVLFTMKRRVPEPWRHSIRGRLWYWMTCRHIRRNVRNGGGTLVVKSRVKHGDPWWLRRLGQYYLDNPIYPHIGATLIRQAQEVVHFGSGVAWEAMAAGVPHRMYRVPRPHLAGLPGQQDIERTVDGTVSREEFLRDWIGVLDGKAGERVADVIEEQL